MNRVFFSCFVLLFFRAFSADENLIPQHLFCVSYKGAVGNQQISSKTSYINGIGGGYQFYKNRFSYGVDYHFLFGYYSGIDLFSAIRTGEGKIISDQGSLIDLQVLFRGNSAYFSIGSFVPLSRISQLQFNMGIGILEHHLSIKTLDGTSAYLAKNNLKGYDQLSMGLALRQEIRINHFGPKKRVNCYFQLFFEEGFLQNTRTFNYFNNTIDTKNHFNFIAGAQLGWMIPLFNTNLEEDF